MTWYRGVPQLALVACVALGCNALFGIEKPIPFEERQGGDGGAGGDSGGCDGDPACNLNSDRCERDATQCVGRIFQTCGPDGVWEETEECEFLCDNEEGCYGACQPGRAECESAVLRKACNEEGQWSDPLPCPDVCSDGKCETGCVPEKIECQGRDLSVCRSDATWRVEVRCPYVCDDDEKRCRGECRPGARACAGSDLQECDSFGEYQLVATCPAACIEDEEAVGGFRCADCSPGEEQCDDNVVEVCQNDGTFAPTEDCFETNETCVETEEEALCEGDCAPGQVDCDGWDAIECTAGAWTLRDDCSEPDEICRLGECEDNSPHDIGESSADGWVSGDLLDEIQYLVPVTVSVRSELLAFRVRTFGGPGSVVMALYDEVGGEPRNLLVTSSSFAQIPALDTGEETNVTVVSPAATFTLEPGVTYYVAALFTSNVTTIPTKPGPGWEGFGSYPVHPDVTEIFGYEGNAYPFFLTVREQP